MKSISKCVAVMALLIATSVSYGQGNTVSTRVMMINPNTPQDCPTDCEVKIAMSGTQDFCQGTISGYVHVKRRFVKQKVTWKLSPTSDRWGVYEFHEKHGMLIIKDDDTEIDTTFGGWGDGSNPNDKSAFHKRVLNNGHPNPGGTISPSTVTYLPAVVRRGPKDKSGNEPLILCGMGDPKIVSDGP
jgi:hypothetical protein